MALFELGLIAIAITLIILTLRIKATKSTLGNAYCFKCLAQLGTVNSPLLAPFKSIESDTAITIDPPETLAQAHQMRMEEIRLATEMLVARHNVYMAWYRMAFFSVLLAIVMWSWVILNEPTPVASLVTRQLDDIETAAQH